MSPTRWSLCLLSLTIVLVCSGQDESNSAQYLFSSIRDLRLHQQQQHPRRNQIQNTALRQISQPQYFNNSNVASRIIRKDDSLQTQELIHNEPLRRIHNSMEATGQSVEDSSVQESKPQQPPPLELTRGELANLYENAIRKGNTVRLNAEGTPIRAAVHHLDENGNKDHSEATPNQHEGVNRGYYYYYYPLKSFMHELSSHSHNQDHDNNHDNREHYHVAENYYHHDTDNIKSHSHDSPYIYEHTHQHNVHIEPIKTEMDKDKKSKGLEPLFMAISGFIGMTVMFILSMLMMPKFGHALKSRHRTKGEDDEVDVVRIVLSTLEGQDCRERLACEMGKAASALNLYDNRLVKFVRRIGPVSIRRRIDKIGKYTEEKFKCASIQCKRKDGTLKPKDMH